jgi:hypothetical protein
MWNPALKFQEHLPIRIWKVKDSALLNPLNVFIAASRVCVHLFYRTSSNKRGRGAPEKITAFGEADQFCIGHVEMVTDNQTLNRKNR